MSLKFANNNSLSAIDTKPSGLTGGSITLLSTQTASSSANITYDSNIDSTYKEYIFKYTDIHPATDNASFQVNFRDGSTAYDATKTTTNFRCYHDEAGTTTSLSYLGIEDLAQSTAVQIIGRTIGADNDQCGVGNIHLFDPSNTTFVKHFIARGNCQDAQPMSRDGFAAGYLNTTSAIDAIQFKMSSGNIDSGVIKLYGVS